MHDEKEFTLDDAENLRLIYGALTAINALACRAKGNARRHWVKLEHDLRTEAGKLERRRLK
jgi:hypothetical protein